MPYKSKEKQNSYQNEWMKRKRESFLNGKVCKECGSISNLQVDHIDPNEKISHRIWSWSDDRIAKELEKCQILCETCHTIKSSVESSGHKPYKHGTRKMYERHGCRCAECTQSNSARIAKQRAKRKLQG